MIKLPTLISLILILLVIISCDAPRLNPLDPQSPDYNLGQLSGRVYAGLSHDLTSGVSVIWKNEDVITKTDSIGRYVFNDIKMNDGYIYFEKNGLSKDSLKVIWNKQTAKQLDDVILHYTTGQLSGYVKTDSIPRLGIPDVNVYWKNQNIVIKTSSSGYFSFDNLPHESGYLYFEKTGYIKDSTEVNFGDSQTTTIGDVFLNSLPNLRKFLLYTTVENRPPDIQRVRLEVRALVRDSDGQSDIDTVFLKCSELNWSQVLIYGGQQVGYQKSFVQADLNLTSLDEAIGKIFNIYVKDKRGNLFNIGTSNIKRIIKQIVSIESPANRVTTTSTPTLKWNRFKPGFNFTYSARIYTDDVQKDIVWSKDGISKDDTEVLVDVPISSGDYFWIISCVDDFGDEADSTPGSFTVQ